MNTDLTEGNASTESEVLTATELQEEDDLSAGFAKVKDAKNPDSTDGKTTEKTKPASATVDNTTAAVTAKPAEVAKAAEMRIAGFTEEEIKAKLARLDGLDAKIEDTVSRMHGKIGDVNRLVSELTTKLAGGHGSAAAPRKFIGDFFKRVSAELPGFGELLAEDLNEAFGAQGINEAKAEAAAKGEAFDPEKYFAETLSPALMAMEARAKETTQTQISDAVQKALINYIHPDFDEVCRSPEFEAWLKTLPKEREAKIRSTDVAAVVAPEIEAFKKQRDALAKAQKSKTSRLERAAPPQAGASEAESNNHDEDDDLSAGFNKVRKQTLRNG